MAKQCTKSGPGRTHQQGATGVRRYKRMTSMAGWYSALLSKHFATQRVLYGNTGRVV